MKKILSIIIVTMIIAGGFLIAQPVPVSAQGSTLEVGEGKAYVTIQAAVDAALPGDTILVYPGFYEESVLVITDNLKLLAESDGVEVYSPIGGTAPIRVYADRVTVRGFSQLTGTMDCVPGIYFEGSYNVFGDNVIDPGSCPGVNALECRDPDGGSNFNRIENNTIVHGDLGIVMTSTAPHALNIGNVIKNNTLNGIAGTGIAVVNGYGFNISGNHIPGTGAGHCMTVIAENGTPQGHHRIMNNEASYCRGYGIALWADNQTTFKGNWISQNEVSFSFHGINLYADPEAALVHNVIQDNTVYQNFEVGIWLQPGAGFNYIQENLVETNHGLGILISSNNNKILNNNVSDNAADGIHVEGNFNKIISNTAHDNDGWDLADYGLHNRWLFNDYDTASWE